MQTQMFISENKKQSSLYTPPQEPPRASAASLVYHQACPVRASQRPRRALAALCPRCACACISGRAARATAGAAPPPSLSPSMAAAAPRSSLYDRFKSALKLAALGAAGAGCAYTVLQVRTQGREAARARQGPIGAAKGASTVTDGPRVTRVPVGVGWGARRRRRAGRASAAGVAG